MKSTNIKIFLAIVFIFLQFSVFAQKKNSWTDWEELYSDTNIKVEIRFKIRENSCQSGGKNSKYKYKLTGTLYTEEKFVYWKMKYKACNNQDVEVQNSIAIGGKDATIGIVESLDYIFLTKKLIKNHYDENTKKIKPPCKLDKKDYRADKRTIRKTIPHKYSIHFGGGLYSDIGTTLSLGPDIFNNMDTWIYDPFISVGIFRKIGIKKKFTPKNNDNSRATLFGVFADAGLYNVGINNLSKNDFDIQADGFLHLESGFLFWEIIRLSAGIIDYNIDENFDDFLYSTTFGLTLKIRKFQLYINYTQSFEQSFELQNSYLQAGFNISLNFFRTVPKQTKEKLKENNCF